MTQPPNSRNAGLADILSELECPQVTHIEPGFPVFFEKALGSRIWDVEGREYIDFNAGFGVCNLGHNHPELQEVWRQQSSKLAHAMGDVHPSSEKAYLLQGLRKILPIGLDKTLLALSGSEAVEAAVKTAWIYSGKQKILAFEGAYHGLTFGALHLTHREYFKKPFQKLLGNWTKHLPYPNSEHSSALPQVLEAVDKTLASGDIAAVVFEPVLGRGGEIIPPKGFYSGLRQLTQKHGVLLIADEIYTGFGRTGKLFAHEHENVLPDLICLGKGLANGFPISACVGRADIMDAWGKSKGEALHTSTFLGHPVGSAVARKCLELHQSPISGTFMTPTQQAALLGEKLKSILQKFKTYFSEISRADNLGLLGALEFRDKDGAFASKIMKLALNKGLILLQSGEFGNILSISPPLTISNDDFEGGMAILHECLVETGA